MSLNEQLLAAAALAQADEVAALINRGASVNAADENGETALIKAAKSIRKGRVDTVRCLIEAGANVNRKDKFGLTALMEAVSGKPDSSLDTIRLLINAGANVNAKSRGCSALIIAVEKKADSRVHFLVNAGAKIDSPKEAKEIFDTLIAAAWNKRLKGNITQICKALRRAGLFQFSKEKMLASAMRGGRDEHTEIAKYLIQSGADISCLQEELHHFFDYAMRKGNIGTFTLIIDSGLKSDYLDFDYGLYEAAKLGHTEIVKLLIESGANIDKAKVYTQEALSKESRPHLRSGLELGMLLLKNYASKSEASSKQTGAKKQNNSALLQAAVLGDANTASHLIKEGADINARDDTQRTPIIISAISRRANIVKILIDAGADINTTDTKGRSALSYAVQSDADIATMLIDGGADTNIVDVEGYSPLMLAVSAMLNNSKVISSLVSAGANVNVKRNDGNTALMDAIKTIKKGVIKTLLNAGAETNAINDEGWSALMRAAYRWDVSIMELLIEAGAKVNAKNNKGETALTKAITSSRWPPDSSDREIVVQYLIEHGADVNIVDKDDWSLLKKATWLGHTNIVKLLIDAGADANAIDNGGWTALMLAQREGFTKIAALLKEAGARK